MAGETEDCISFQAEHLPTGSISFGRFELESLSWERRSSFSHNRFLEEVEKYSTPGSVSQKRAILEAHFKKRPLLPQSSLDFSSAECQTTENDRNQHANCSVEFEYRDNGREPEFAWYDDTPTSSVEHEEMECEQAETWPAEFPNESMSCNDEREIEPNHELSDREQILQHQQENDSITSNKDELCIVTEQEPDNKDVIVEELVENKEAVVAEQLLENKETILVEELKSDASSMSPAVVKEGVSTLKKKTQKATFKHSSVSNKDELCIVTEQEPDNKDVIVEELVENKEAVVAEQLLENKETILVEELKSDASSMSPAVVKEGVSTLKKKTQKATFKGKQSVEQKSAKTKPMNRLPVQQNLRKSSTERSYVSSSKMLSRSTGKLEKESTPRTKSVKQLPLPSRTPRPMSSDSQSLKLEASVNLKTKVRQGSRRYELTSEKDVRAKKTSITPHSISAKSEMDVCRPVSRSRVADSTEEETKQSGAIFSFKSDERAEKRKEYYMKLEEKLHAKEVEMSEIHARTQEETEAAIKQFRRSLNFKATPIPSFYHEAVPRASEGKKKVGTSAKPQMQSKCTTPGNQTFPREKSLSLSKPSNRGRPSSSGQSQSISKPPNRERPSSSGPNQASGSTKSSEKGKKDERIKIGGNSNGKKGMAVNRVRRGGMGSMVKGSIVGGSVAVHVAS